MNVIVARIVFGYRPSHTILRFLSGTWKNRDFVIRMQKNYPRNSVFIGGELFAVSNSDFLL